MELWSAAGTRRRSRSLRKLQAWRYSRIKRGRGSRKRHRALPDAAWGRLAELAHAAIEEQHRPGLDDVVEVVVVEVRVQRESARLREPREHRDRDAHKDPAVEAPKVQ